MIATKGKDGRPNGWLLPLWNVHDRPDLRPDQVYLTAIEHGCSKGPHLHMKREQRYYCIRGSVRVVGAEPGGGYSTYDTVAGDEVVCVVRPGTPSMLINIGNGEAWVINMPAPAWHPDDRDDWPVEGWDYKGDS